MKTWVLTWPGLKGENSLMAMESCRETLQVGVVSRAAVLRPPLTAPWSPESAWSTWSPLAPDGTTRARARQGPLA